MAITTGVPCSISGEATARVAELGIQREFDQMLEFARACTPNLNRIDVSVESWPELGGDPRIVIDAFVDECGEQELNPGEDLWYKWAINNFTPDVLCEVVMLIWYEAGNER